MLKKKKTMPSAKPGHGSKRPTDAQPQNEILRSRGVGGNPQQAAPEAEWLSRGIACRVTYTKNAIKDALLELMKEKSFEKLSISRVCEAAQITRTTFL